MSGCFPISAASAVGFYELTLAFGGGLWSVEGLQLVPGPNVIEVVATDGAGNSSSDTAVIFLLPPDSVPPAITIEFPTINPVFEAFASEINLSGSATDGVGVARVEWSDGRGGHGLAVGVNPWSVNGIALQQGVNVIEVIAYDHAGNSAADTLAISYAPALQLADVAVRDGSLEYTIFGPPSTSVQIQASTDLKEWTPLTATTPHPMGRQCHPSRLLMDSPPCSTGQFRNRPETETRDCLRLTEVVRVLYDNKHNHDPVAPPREGDTGSGARTAEGRLE